MARQLKVSVILESIAQTTGFQRFNQELRAADLASKKLKPTLDFIGNTMKSVAAVGTAAAAVFGKGAQASIAYASNITDLANAAQISTDAMQVLGHQATLNGAAVEDMSKAIIQLQSNAADAARGNAALAAKFARLGIDAQTFARTAPVEQMERLGRAAVQAEGDQEGLAAVMDLIGAKNAPKLMAALRDLGERGFAELARGAQSAGVVMEEGMVRRLDAAGDKIEVLKNRLTVFAGTWATGALDIIDATTGINGALAKVTAAEQASGPKSLQAAKARLDLAEMYLAEGKAQEALFNLRRADLTGAAAVNAMPQSTVDRGAEIDETAERRRRLAVRIRQLEEQQQAETAKRTAAAANDADEAARVAAQSAQAAQNKQLDASVKAFSVSLKQKLDGQIKYDAAARESAAKTTAQMESDVADLIEEMGEWRAQNAETALSLTQAFQTPAEAAQRQLELATRLKQGNLITAETYRRVGEAASLAAREADTKRMLASFGPLKQALNEIQYSISNNLTQSLTDFVMTGKLGMKELGQAILRDLVSALIRAQIVMPLMNAIGGAQGLVPNLFAAPAADGGFRSGSRPYLVGENGPEIFDPGSPGTVIPADETASMLSGRSRRMANAEAAPAIVIHNHFATGVTRAELATIIPGIVNQTKAAVADAVRRGGSYRRAYA